MKPESPAVRRAPNVRRNNGTPETHRQVVRYAETEVMAALDRIEISGFKSIERATLTLPRLTVLIGGNGAGKSNFIGLFALLHEMVERRLQDYVQRHGGAESLLHFGPKRTTELKVGLSFGPNSYSATLVPDQDESLFYAHEECTFQSYRYPYPYSVPLGNAHRESGLTENAQANPGKTASHVLESIRSWKVYHFHDTSGTAKVKAFCDIDDNLTLRPDASNLAAFLYRLQTEHPLHFQQIVSTIQSVTPFFEAFQLRESPRKPEKIRIEWRERGSNAYFNAHSFSDGTLRFICLATLLLQPTPPTTILLDEPELGLHPYAIQVLAALLRAASHRTQVVVSTQSVTLVNQFAPEDLLITERENGATVFKRGSAEMVKGWEDYGLGELWEKNVLGGRPSR